MVPIPHEDLSASAHWIATPGHGICAGAHRARGCDRRLCVTASPLRTSAYRLSGCAHWIRGWAPSVS